MYDVWRYVRPLVAPSLLRFWRQRAMTRPLPGNTADYSTFPGVKAARAGHAHPVAQKRRVGAERAAPFVRAE